MKISKSLAEKMLKTSDGKFFSVTFEKLNGEERTLNGRLGVTKKLKGYGLKYNPEAIGYLICYDVKIKDYRTVNLNTLKRFKLNGIIFDVED